MQQKLIIYRLLNNTCCNLLSGYFELKKNKSTPMLKNKVTLMFCILFGWQLSAQDIHYSQFFNSPLNLSPGLTGMYNGDQRYHLNLRQQWANVPVNYESGDIGADFKIRNRNNKNFIGIGGLINYDKAGDLELSLTGINLFVSYGLQVSDKSTLTPAITAGYAQRRFEPSAVTSGNQWDGEAYNPSIPAETFSVDNFNYFDLGGGLNYRWQSAYRKHLDVGIGLYHFIKPTDSFNPGATTDAYRPLRMSFYGMFNYPIANKIDVILNGLYAKQESYSETVVNGQFKVYLGQSMSAALYLGGGYRFNDAWYPMIAIEVGRIYGAFSYDMNISDFEIATDGRGGPELSLRYIFAKIPEGINKPCPLY